MQSIEDFSQDVEFKGNGETHISSKETFPRLSTNPGVDSLLGKATARKLLGDRRYIRWMTLVDLRAFLSDYI